MRMNAAVQRWATLARDTVMPPRHEFDPIEEAGQAEALALWQGVFMPFGPLVDDADILEIGSGDGRLLGRLITHGAARSATGVEPGVPGDEWIETLEGKVRSTGELACLDALPDGSFDLVLARQLDGDLPLEGLETRLRRLYDLLRPGGEAILRLGCGANGTDAGYGFLTPSSWAALLMRAGFEIVDLRRVWRGDRDQSAAVEALPWTADEERLCGEVRVHLIRAWEAWELEAITAPTRRRRR